MFARAHRSKVPSDSDVLSVANHLRISTLIQPFPSLDSGECSNMISLLRDRSISQLLDHRPVEPMTHNDGRTSSIHIVTNSHSKSHIYCILIQFDGIGSASPSHIDDTLSISDINPASQRRWSDIS